MCAVFNFSSDGPSPRLYCDICDVHDAHDTEDCPQQEMWAADDNYNDDDVVWVDISLSYYFIHTLTQLCFIDSYTIVAYIKMFSIYVKWNNDSIERCLLFNVKWNNKNNANFDEVQSLSSYAFKIAPRQSLAHLLDTASKCIIAQPRNMLHT